MPETAIAIITGTLFSFWIVFFNVVLVRRYRLLPTIAVQTAAFTAVYICSRLFPFVNFTFRLLISFLLASSSALLMFQDKLPRILLAVLLAHLWMVISNLLLVIVLPEVSKVDAWLTHQPVLIQASIVLLDLLFNTLMLLITAAVLNRYRSLLLAREWALYILIPLSQIMITVLWFQTASTDTHGVTAIYQTLSLFVCITADVALFFAVRAMAQRTELKAENDLLAKQIDIQKSHYTELTDQYKNIRRMRHDIASHVYTIRLLLEEKKLKEADAYAAELITQQDYCSQLGSCENPVVDAYLYNRIAEARRQGVEVSVDVSLPDGLQIANKDLISALGNLVENAFEACSSQDHPAVRLTAHVSRGFVVFSTENPKPSDGRDTKKRRVPELERGIGFHILKELAKKYDGSFSFTSEKDVFRAVLTMKSREDMILVAICDDEALHLSHTRQIVSERLRGQNAELSAFSCSEDLINAITNTGYVPDVAILDIRMEGMDGIELARRLNTLVPQCGVIFLSSYLSYVTEIYETEHVYFVLKSDLDKRIGPALTKALTVRRIPEPLIRYRERTAIKMIPSKYVLYLERILHKTRMVTESETLWTTQPPAELLSGLPKDLFIRCHQSYWVNAGAISMLESNNFVLVDGTRLPLSRTYRGQAKEQFLKSLIVSDGDFMANTVLI